MESAGGQTSTSDGAGGVPNQLAMLVPSFDPATDNVDIWSSKVTLLLEAWPQNKIIELITRLILSTKGSAYQKLHLHQKDLLVNDRKGVQKLVELVGGTWGQVPLEHRFELVEKALFRSQQKADESGDSFIARVDVIWTELLAKEISLDQVQAYVLLRGSRLSAEDKKRVLVESGAETPGKKLEWSKVVAAIRMLGSAFFQDYTGVKREKNMKTYDHLAFNVDEVDDDGEEHETFWVSDDPLDEDTLAQLMSENDEDAALIVQFEEAVTEAVQNDSDLATYFSSYQDARRRLTERVKFRGFWPVKKGSKGFGKKGAGKSGGKGKTLAQRIANSNCRLCGKKGHWKAECSLRSSAASSTAPSDAASVPISVAVTENDVPSEIVHLPEMHLNEPLSSESEACFGVICNGDIKINGINRVTVQDVVHKMRTALRNELVIRDARDAVKPTCLKNSPLPLSHMHDVSDHMASSPGNVDIHFASSGTNGIVDLGASQTVIGSQQVTDLLQGLPDHVRAKAHRTPCQLVFRFGNHQTLTSKHALMLPLQQGWFRIAVVPGPTPFLLSSTFLKQIKAVIDTEEGTMWSKALQRNLVMERSTKNLFLMDLNQLWDSDVAGSTHDEASCVAQTALSDGGRTNVAEPQGSLRESEPNVSRQSENPSHCPLSFSVESQVSGQPLAVVNLSEQNCRTDQKCTAASDQSPIVERASTYRQDAIVGAAVQGLQQDSESARVSRCGVQHDPGRAGFGEDCLRGIEEGPDVCQGLRRSAVDRVHFEPVREQREARTHDVYPLHSAATSGRAEEVKGVSDHQGRHQGATSSSSRCVGGTSNCGWDGVRDERRLCAGRNAGSTPEQPEPLSPCGPDRVHDAGSLGPPAQDASEDGGIAQLSRSEAERLRHSVFAEEAHLNTTLDTDFDFSYDPNNMSFHRRIQRLINVFQKELDQVVDKYSTKMLKLPKLDLLEVMCSSKSELVKQATLMGGRAKRFGLAEGDLQTVSGRQKLFFTLVTQDPKSLWYSPECGPWSRWSVLNMGKSLQGLHDVLEKRSSSLWQISLAVVLYRYQMQRSHHFHMEQPEGSHMLKLPQVSEITDETLLCRFDLCRMGKLVDPESSMPIRKRLNVVTSSEALANAIHGKLCNQDHQHRQIAGSIRHQGHRMSLSSFTENYPVKFARQVVKVLLYQSPKDKPVLTVSSNSNSEEPSQPDEHPTKKRRLGKKMSPIEIARRFASVNWQTVMQRADQEAPRVGPLVIDSGDLIQAISQLCPEHEIKHVVLCRGTDRYSGPTRSLPPGTAPLRRRVCIRRRHEDIVVDDEWERWERLTFKGLRRKGTPARVSLTAFACAKTVIGQRED